MRRRPSVRRIAVIGLAALVGVNAVAYAAFTLPSQVRERNLASRAEELRADLARAQERERAEHARDEAIAQNAKDLKAFYAEVVGSREATLLPIMRELEANARDLQLVASRTSFAPESLKDLRLTRVRVQVPVGGAYSNLVAFLRRIERSPHFLVLDQVRLNDQPQSGAQGRTLDLALSAYFKEESGAKPAARAAR